MDEILDSNAGTRSISKEFEDEGIDDALQSEWVDCARRTILIRGLKEFILLDGKRETGKEVDTKNKDRDRELWVTILAWLEMSTSTAVDGQQMVGIEELMKDEIEYFKELDWSGNLGREVGEYFDRIESVVRELALGLVDESSAGAWIERDQKSKDGYSLTSSIPAPRTLHSNNKANMSIASRRHHPSSPSSSSLLRTYTTHQNFSTSALSTLLSDLTTNLSTLLSLHSALLTSQIQRLETFTFSTQTRHLTTRASFLATVAQGIALKARILALGREREVLASEGIGGMLEGVMEDLRAENRDLEARERDLRSLLDGSGGGERMGDGEMERIMGELGREYRNILMETEVVKGDLERLEGELKSKERR